MAFLAQNKQAFLNVFSELYDANGLTAQLKEQLRKSNTLLQTLQASGAMIEGELKHKRIGIFIDAYQRVRFGKRTFQRIANNVFR